MKKIILIWLLLIFVLHTNAQNQSVEVKSFTKNVHVYEKRIFNLSLEFGADTLTAKMIVAQAKLESGNFKNPLTRKHNNVFSMQHPKRRKTTSIGAFATAEKRPKIYASYKTVRDAVRDLFLYFEARKIEKTQPSIDSYVKILKKKKFYESSEQSYKKALKKHFNKITL